MDKSSFASMAEISAPATKIRLSLDKPYHDLMVEIVLNLNSVRLSLIKFSIRWRFCLLNCHGI